ncbi:hypothetical protein EUTSA_v10012958mg [Eutrema salsugineum]|uniref:DUF3741 domain-containing protein n=2 Tax=Eutrema salsugineum TaxID=72664 RepID=V4NBQ6_EUTSA|nr:hypothetical protein EUTSA_v10012958mg [Eutrema salsugineum]
MGRDCHRLGGHGGEGGGVISSSKSKRKANAANGCMAAFYHLFDFQHFHFPSHHNLSIDSPSRSKGLKVIEESPPSTTYKDKQSLSIPASMRVRTETGAISSRLRALATDTSTSSSDICGSPGSKTPNLVARLMGLDLLPDKTDLNDSPSNLHTMTHYGSSRHTSHRVSKNGTRLGTRSLPESPRISSARKSDFDSHRLSLQLNKENKHEEFGCSRLKAMKQDQDENRSPRDYARQIVKQIKERVVTRRVVGMDITNSVKNRDARPSQYSNELRRDTTVSCSPRTRFSDKENKPRTSQKPNSSSSFRPEQITQKPKPKPTTAILVSVSKSCGEKQNQKKVKQRQLRPINQCKKAESETRFSPRPIKSSPNKRREALLPEPTYAKASNPLHRKKLKKTPKSSDLVNIYATESTQKQINETVEETLKSNEEASICSSSIHKIEQNSRQVDDAATVSVSSSFTSERVVIDSEQDYVRRIMKLAARINTDSPISSATMLDFSIFREMENTGENQSGSLALQCNRKLLFDLVNEILIETVKRRRDYHESELIGELCSIVSRYSSKRCSIPEDIALIDFERLLERKKLDEEGEDEIVAEIERDIVDAFVRETASELCFHRRRSKTTSDGKLSYQMIFN